MGETYGAPMETPAERAEAAEDIDGMSERGGVSLLSPTEEIGLRQVPRQGGEGTMAMVKGSWPGVS